jgi:hypothetical protein
VRGAVSWRSSPFSPPRRRRCRRLGCRPPSTVIRVPLQHARRAEQEAGLLLRPVRAGREAGGRGRGRVARPRGHDRLRLRHRRRGVHRHRLPRGTYVRCLLTTWMYIYSVFLRNVMPERGRVRCVLCRCRTSACPLRRRRWRWRCRGSSSAWPSSSCSSPARKTDRTLLLVTRSSSESFSETRDM